MDITELENFRLADAVKFHNSLNPRIWGSDEHLLPEVRQKLLAIAEDFKEFLGLDLEVTDITISGSNAAYTYTDHSDIDLHLVADLPKADANEVYRELFDAKKYQYNDQHNFKIGGYDVELYVQNANETPVSQGIYSVLDNKWISVPKRRKPDVDDISVRSKYEDLGQRIEAAIRSGNREQLETLGKKVREFRQAGLDRTGEFGPENLAFKVLRSNGTLDQLRAARLAAKDQELSIEEAKKKKKPFRYGFGGYYFPGYHYYGQTDAAADGGGGDGGGESVRESADDLQTQLEKFAAFCVKKLGIENLPGIQLKRDPEWSRRNATFGQYISEINTLILSVADRHPMDIMRTLAHELVHCSQDEHEPMPDHAGETGSEWENEANAQAGVLMRSYGEQNPDTFEKKALAEGSINESSSDEAWELVGQPVPEIQQFVKQMGYGNDEQSVEKITTIIDKVPSTQIPAANIPKLKNLANKGTDVQTLKAVQQISGRPDAEQQYTKLMQARDAGEGRNRDVSGYLQYVKSGNYDPPVLLKLPTGIYVIGGRTRLYAALALGVPAKVKVISADSFKQGVAEGYSRKLNFDEVYGRYLKVTDNDGDPNKKGFSLVTPLNGASWNWRERPEFIPLVKKKLNQPGWLGDYKYQQIIDSMAGNEFDPVKHLAEASGYIPVTDAEARDPRYSMAVTVDIRPGEIQRQARKMGWKTDAAGIPPLLTSNASNLRESQDSNMKIANILKETTLGGFPVKVLHIQNQGVDETSPMIKPPGNRFDSKQEAFAHVKQHGGKVFKNTYTDPNTGIKNITFVVRKEQGITEAIKLNAPQRTIPRDELQGYADRIKTGTKTKRDKFSPIIHGSNIKAITKDDNNTEWDLDDLSSQITTRPRAILGTNAKMEKSKTEGEIIYDLTLPALSGIVVDEDTGDFVEITTCPGAGACQLFCYARKGGYVMFPASSMSAAQALNFLVNDPEGYTARVNQEIKTIKEKTDKAGVKLVVRWHDAGDFFSKEYLDLAYGVAQSNPDVQFYAYTKMGDVATGASPANFTMNFSSGSKRGEEKKVEFYKQQNPGATVKQGVTVPKDMFFDLIARKGNSLIKDAKGRTQFASPDALNTFKQRIAQQYKVAPDSIITYDQMLATPVGSTPQWNVIVQPGAGDRAANRKDVIDSYLMFH